MHLTHLIRIAYQLLLLITFLILCVTLRENADRQTKAREVDEGRIEFAANRRAIWAWILLVIYLIYATIRQLNVSHGRPLDLIGATGLGALALVAAFSFPYTIIVAPDGLQQIAWLRGKKKIRLSTRTNRQIARVCSWNSKSTAVRICLRISHGSRLLIFNCAGPVFAWRWS